MIQQDLFGDRKEVKEVDKLPVEPVRKYGGASQQSLTPREIDTSILREKTLFDAGYLLGSTTVWMEGGRYFFVGDISHCGMKVITHNATRMKEEMAKKGMSSAHMNYNDLPEFERKRFDKEHFDKDNTLYHHDIYTWDDSGNALMYKMFGTEPQGEIYFNAEEDKKEYDEIYARIAAEIEYAKSLGVDLNGTNEIVQER